MNTDYRVGEWVIRPQLGCIERGDEVVHLKPKPMAVLECLAQSGNGVVSRDGLFEKVWPGGVVSDATLTQCIVELRRAFGDSAQQPRIIKTIPKVGFCLIPEVEPLLAKTRAPGHGAGLEPPGDSKRFHLLVATTAVAVVVAMLLLGTWWYQGNAPSGVTAPPAHETAGPSMAVLPLVDMSEESGNEYFADGLSEDLRNLLAKIPQLKVAARTSSFAFRESDLMISEIADALNVAHVLEGSVRKSGNRIRITVHLVDAKTGFDLWSEQYDRNLDDIFAVQDEIAAAVVDALRLNLVGETPRQQETGTEVYSLYLQGLYFLNRVTRQGRSKAVEKLQEALAIDPDYAPALQLLAATYLFQSNNEERPFDEGFELGRKTAAEAIAIDPSLASAWGTLAYIESYYDWDWQAAGRSVEKMLELEPVSGTNQYVAASYYHMLGRFEHSLKLRDQAIRLDPVNAYFRESKAYTLLSVGRLQEAESTLQELLELLPAHLNAQRLRAKILLLRGDAQSALERFESLPAEQNQAKGLLATALHGVGRVDEAEVVLESMSSDRNSGASYYRALYHAWVGERDLAFEHLQQAVENRFRVLSYVLGEPLLYPLHDDPRWAELLDQMGLLAYWLEVPTDYGGPSPL